MRRWWGTQSCGALRGRLLEQIKIKTRVFEGFAQLSTAVMVAQLFLMPISTFPFVCLQLGYFHPVKAEVPAFWQCRGEAGLPCMKDGEPMQGGLPLVAGEVISYFSQLYKIPLQGTKSMKGGDRGTIRWLEQHLLSFAFSWFYLLSSSPGVG